jgi:L-cysteine S-thiosulfotransferase
MKFFFILLACLGCFVLASATQFSLEAQAQMKSGQPLPNNQLPSHAPLTELPPRAVTDVRAGRFFLSDQLRAQQNDVFQHPGLVEVDKGKKLYETQCASCHAADLSRLAVRLPRVNAAGDILTFEKQTNHCLTTRLQQPALPHEASPLLQLGAYIHHQAQGQARWLGQPSRPVDEITAKVLQGGHELYNRRQGQLNLSCANCHDQLWGQRLLNEPISQGHSEAYPVYRLEWQGLGSLHRRFRSCLSGIRAQLLPQGAAEFDLLELYLAWRANNLPIDAPGLRR